MRKHRQLMIGLLIGILIGTAAVGLATPDPATEFARQEQAIWDANAKVWKALDVGELGTGVATRIIAQQNRIVIQQNNEIIRLLQALNLKGQG